MTDDVEQRLTAAYRQQLHCCSRGAAGSCPRSTTSSASAGCSTPMASPKPRDEFPGTRTPSKSSKRLGKVGTTVNFGSICIHGTVDQDGMTIQTDRMDMLTRL